MSTLVSGQVSAEQSSLLEQSWKTEERWKGIKRPYSGADVERLRGTVQIEYTLARLGAERLWHLLQTERFVAALGAIDRKSGGTAGQGGA